MGLFGPFWAFLGGPFLRKRQKKDQIQIPTAFWQKAHFSCFFFRATKYRPGIAVFRVFF